VVALLGQAARELLIHQVILREEDAERFACLDLFDGMSNE
jgi:hypothetical protein